MRAVKSGRLTIQGHSGGVAVLPGMQLRDEIIPSIWTNEIIGSVWTEAQSNDIPRHSSHELLADCCRAEPHASVAQRPSTWIPSRRPCGMRYHEVKAFVVEYVLVPIVVVAITRCRVVLIVIMEVA